MSFDPTILVMSCRGNSRLNDFLELCSLNKCLRALIKLTISLNEIHSKGVLHGDLKMDNVMVQNEHDPRNFTVNIIDFGLAESLGANRRIYRKRSCHYPPESHYPGKASSSFDVYSLGDIIHHTCEMLAYIGCPEDLISLAQLMKKDEEKQRPNLTFVINSLSKILEENMTDEEDSGESLIQWIARWVSKMKVQGMKFLG
ncbi:hypothetical protein OTU49_014594 [Cherax quadricarinatus]|uniref:Protein kinase domain-containing protein n=1 Tax=Cherax quadricarinatus TaxID=27406 RepID=A0AAW0VMY9_CHEQU